MRYGYGYGVNRRRSAGGLNPVVQAFVDANSITDTDEQNALNALYIGLQGVMTAHGNGSILYLNGMSPTSFDAAKEAIIFGTGNETAIQIELMLGPVPTHSSDGILFPGSNSCWDIGNVLNGLAQDRVMTAFTRTNTITINGVSIGVNPASGQDIQLFPRTSASNSGYNVPANYTTAQDFSGSANWIGYRDATTYAIWEDGTLQTPDSTSSPVSSGTTTDDVYIGGRNNMGTAANFVDDRMRCVLVIDDGNVRMSNAQVQAIDALLTTYNANVA